MFVFMHVHECMWGISPCTCKMVCMRFLLIWFDVLLWSSGFITGCVVECFYMCMFEYRLERNDFCKLYFIVMFLYLIKSLVGFCMLCIKFLICFIVLEHITIIVTIPFWSKIFHAISLEFSVTFSSHAHLSFYFSDYCHSLIVILDLALWQWILSSKSFVNVLS